MYIGTREVIDKPVPYVDNYVGNFAALNRAGYIHVVLTLEKVNLRRPAPPDYIWQIEINADAADARRDDRIGSVRCIQRVIAGSLHRYTHRTHTHTS